ncbi:MAG: TNF receptor-associated protein 1 [Verrucomicrobiales bacterium]|jgi:TNF receptor-associated protein 1
MEFQAEVQQLLDIVINSLYTDKEIFVRELVSNASDALEKLRHLQLTEKEVFDDQLDLEVNITTDDTANTITISDYGIGMTRDELVENIGTIASSGSKKFLQAMTADQQKESNLIGQFGVGFYSAFMVADEVKVYTHSWKNDGEHLCWTSDGKTGYSIEEAEGQRRGCKIVVQLKEDCEDFAKKETIEQLLKKYSNYVPFPINLNGERVNTVEALWLKQKNDLTDEQYSEFYKFQAHAWDEPRYRLHFSADAPIVINSLLFVPTQNQEKFGMAQYEPGVALYCKNILIDPNPKGLLPEWLRFVKGVIDSADLPLNISRESMQDSALVQKLNTVVTKRFIKFLDKEAKKDSEKYLEFYKEFSRFIKEGIAVDHDNRELLAKLLRFESSMTEAGEVTSLDEYGARAKEGQEKIYYLIGPDRATIEAGPFLEAFKARGLEVIFFHDAIDDYVLSSLREFGGKELMSAARGDIELDDTDESPEGETLCEDDSTALCEFLKEHFGDKVETVEVGNRLVGSPVAALLPNEGMNPQMQQMMKAMGQDGGPGLKINLEINPRHDLIKNLSAKRESEPELAKLAASHMLDTALLAAGLLDNQKDLISRGFEVLEKALA